MHETDLYEPVRDWFSAAGWTVRGEVKGCDVAALDGEKLILAELKTSLNFEVVLQAVDRQRTGDIVYIAVPAKTKAQSMKRWKMATHLLKRLDIGLLLVHFPQRATSGGTWVEELLPPVPFDRMQSRHAAKKKREALLKEFRSRSGDHNRGGSVKKPLVTAYREQALQIAKCLAGQGNATPKMLRAMGTDAGKTTAILHDNHYGWFASVSRGIYRLTEKGVEALGLYAPVMESLQKNKLSADADVILGESSEKTNKRRSKRARTDNG